MTLITPADGEMRATMLAGMARFEVRRKGERQRRANEYRVGTGRPVPGRRRFGYESDGVTPRESEASIIRMMFDACRRGVSIPSIMLDIKNNYPAPGTGVDWTPRRVRDTLNNPAYGGDIRHKGGTLPGVVTAIVDPEAAEQVRLMLSDPTRRTSPGSAVKHLASNIAFCGVCGSRLVFMRSCRCRESSAHISILKPLLDAPVRAATIAALQFGNADMLGDPVAGAAAGDLLHSHRRVIELVDETMRREDDGLLTTAHARTRLAKLKRERDLIEASLEHAQRSSAARILVDLRLEVMGSGRVDMDGVVQLRNQISDRFDRLDIVQQRELLLSHLRVTVYKGRSPSGLKLSISSCSR